MSTETPPLLGPFPSDLAKTEHPSRRSTWGRYLLAAMLVAGVIGTWFQVHGDDQLDRASDSAAAFGLIDGPPQLRGKDFAPWGVEASDWMQRYKSAGMEDGTLGTLPVAGVNELLDLGEELVTQSTAPSGDWIGPPKGQEDSLRFLPAFRAGTGLVCVASGKVPSLSTEQRVGALIATVHLADALSRRHLAGLMIASVLLDQGWSCFQGNQAEGLTLSAKQSAHLAAALDKLDLKTAAVRAHAGSVASLLEEDSETPWWEHKAGSARGLLDRLGGRSRLDRVTALELAVLTQKYWLEGDVQALAQHEARVRRLKLSGLPLTESIGVTLHDRLSRIPLTQANVLAWRAELRNQE